MARHICFVHKNLVAP